MRLRIARIRARTADDTLDTYLANTERQDAVERNFIAIGEAIKDLSKMLDLAALDPKGPWREPARFRDFLAHQYEEGVSHPDVWRTMCRSRIVTARRCHPRWYRDNKEPIDAYNDDVRRNGLLLEDLRTW